MCSCSLSPFGSFISARLIQIVLGSLLCALVYRLGARLFDRRTGAVAGAITALVGVCGGLSVVTRATFPPYLVVAMPVAHLCYRATGEFNFLPESGPINLYIGNNPERDRTIMIRPGSEWRELARMPTVKRVRRAASISFARSDGRVRR